MEEGRVVSIAVSGGKGERKVPVPEAFLEAGRGIRGDAHAEGGARQVSLLMDESIEGMRKSAGIEVGYGDFAENIVTRGVDLRSLKVGDRLLVGGTRPTGGSRRAGGTGGSPGTHDAGGNRETALLEVTMIGKECKTPCRIYYQVGTCIMPQEGVFCRVLEPGRVRTGDTVRIVRV